MNERITENIVRNLLKDTGYYDNKSIIVEEQSSENPKIDKLLKNASKSGTGKGYPEFIISFTNRPDEIIVIECKAETSKHESSDRKQYKDYAVDGALLYASYLKKEFDVTAIAVSGQIEQEKKISTFLWLKNSYQPKDIQNKVLLSPKQLTDIIIEQKKPVNEEELVAKAIEYNELLHTYSIPEVERCTVISSILVALQNEAFISSYKEYTNTENLRLIQSIVKSCREVLEDRELSTDKVKVIIDEYSKYQNNKKLTSEYVKDKKTKKDKPNTVLRGLITDINDNILPYIKNDNFDVLGKFYTQFIRYAGSDQKTGLVLTPSHITDFFTELASLTKEDIVFDPCCGTGGFLVSAMNKMLQEAEYEEDKQNSIKSHQLLGIEIREDMFSHACSNMMMRGDGKSNIYHGSCFDTNLQNQIKERKPNIGFLNPPYQDGNAEEQLEFIENTLDCLVKDGTCVAICQMSTALNSKGLKVKERMLKKHTLKAVLSMPNDLFHPIGVVTVILVFEAHKPHDSSIKSFFGYFKDDGFVKRKNKGRVDTGEWNSIKQKWLNLYKNKESFAGLSVTKEVTYKDEWVAEAYMETDYSTLTEEDFIKTMKDFVAFEFKYGH